VFDASRVCGASRDVKTDNRSKGVVCFDREIANVVFCIGAISNLRAIAYGRLERH
jgi:hypothetical protein